jgi:CSLREA domain-containing protein
MRKLLVLGFVLAALLPFSGGQPAYAAAITVTTTDDELNADGDCSLREAIQAANTDAAVDACPAGSGADTITLPAGTYTLAIAGAGEDANATGDLDITADLTINGAGAAATIIDGAALDRVLHLVGGVTAKISGLTMRNGLLVFDGIHNDVGGGMYNQQGSATLTNVTFSGNSSPWGGGMFNGYGSSATLTNVTFSDNSSGSYGRGGGMFNFYSSATLTNVTFSGNSSPWGGGMRNDYSTVTLTNVTFSGNYGGADGGGMFNSSSSATLTNVTFSDNYADSSGGGMFDGDGSSATLTNVTFSGNYAWRGGGMHNWGGTATLTNVTFSGNSSRIGGGMHNWGGSATLTNVTFSGNTATYGGGMHNWGGSATLTNVTFSGNSSQDGGGMDNNYGSSATLTNVTFSGNSSQDGGGLVNNSGRSATLTNVTFSGNSSQDGGGMRNDWTSSATLANVTFSGNTAPVGGGMANYGNPTLTNVTFSGNTSLYGGGMASFGSPTLTNVTFSGNSAQYYGGGTYGWAGTLKNTIVANNSPDDCAGSMTSAGHNLIEAVACRIAGDTTGNIIGSDPRLGPLADNGGSTQTHALLADSPAIDAVPLADCTDLAGNPVATDQRGVARPQGAACDIGAFELEPSDSTPPAITLTTPAQGAVYTLNQAVLAHYTCEDEAEGSGLASCVGDVPDGAAIDTASVGPNAFTVTAEDNAANTASLTHAYSVVYSFSGFFRPVDNLPVLNSVKAGSGVPVKFSLSGNQGLSIFATGYPGSQKITCDASAPLDGIEETVTAGSSSLSYDPIADQYVYVWKTDKAWAGTCRQLIVRLNDGTQHVANFKFK